MTTREKGGLYVLSGNRDAESGNLRIEVLLKKFIKSFKSQDSFLEEIKIEISGLNHKVESRLTTIKQLKQQFGHMFAILNQC